MGIGSALVQGGLLSREVDKYNEQQAVQGLRMRQVQKGVRDLEDDEAARPQRNAIAELRRDIERAELEFKRVVQPAQQAIASSELQHQAAMQPGKQTLEREAQNAQRLEAREKQLARVWSLFKAGDKDGALEVYNASELIAPGRKAAKIEEISGPAPDGTQHHGVLFVPGDGGQPILVQREQLDGLVRKHFAKFLNVGGGNVVEVGPEGAKLAFSGGQQAHEQRVKLAERQHELRMELEAFKRKNGAGAATSLQKNIQFLIDQGIAETPGDAFDKLRTAMEKPEADAVASIATNLMRGPGFAGPNGADKAIAQAKRMLEQIRGAEPSATGKYKTAEDVRAAYRTKKIDRATALRELERFGFDAE
jgi:hypothetical protein